MPNLVQVIKQAAVEAVEASKPARFVYGTVKKAAPLAIALDQKITLTSEFLILSRNVTDYTVDVTIETELSTEKGKITVHNSLKAGDKVIMLRDAGGQSFYVLDKL